MKKDKEEHLICYVDDFKKEASLKSKGIEITWLGYELNLFQFSIYNSSNKKILFQISNIMCLGEEGSSLPVSTAYYLNKSPSGWMSEVSMPIYDDMKVKFVFKIERRPPITIGRFIYEQQIFTERGEMASLLFDFRKHGGK